MSEDNTTSRNGENNSTENPQENQFGSINKEIEDLVWIKDILDELSILKSLIKDQKKVWNDAFSESTTEKEYLNSREPSEILETLEEMITDAMRVERSVSLNPRCSMAILPLTDTDKQTFGSKAEAGQFIRSSIITRSSRRNYKARQRSGRARKRNAKARYYSYGIYDCYHHICELSQQGPRHSKCS